MSPPKVVRYRYEENDPTDGQKNEKYLISFTTKNNFELLSLNCYQLWAWGGHFPQIYTTPLLEVIFLNIHVRNLILCL